MEEKIKVGGVDAGDPYGLKFFQAVSQMQAELATLRAENDRLREALVEVVAALDGEPEYHYQGMGCGLEDRNITDRYDAMEYGWDQAMERIFSEHINHAADIAKESLK